MSRLAAQKEFVFMKALHENGFRVPEPIAWNRHTIVMSLIDGVPLRAVRDVANPAWLYANLMESIVKFARFGLIHGDFNEFNIIMKEEREPKSKGTDNKEPSPDDPEHRAKEVEQIEGHRATSEERKESGVPWIIDFPQAVSIDHANAEFYFERDVQCIKTFFERRFRFTSSEPGPFFHEARKVSRDQIETGGKRLDLEVEASGFSRKLAKELEKYIQDVRAENDAHGEDGDNAGTSSDESDHDEECSPDQEIQKYEH